MIVYKNNRVKAIIKSKDSYHPVKFLKWI